MGCPSLRGAAGDVAIYVFFWTATLPLVARDDESA